MGLALLSRPTQICKSRGSCTYFDLPDTAARRIVPQSFLFCLSHRDSRPKRGQAEGTSMHASPKLPDLMASTRRLRHQLGRRLSFDGSGRRQVGLQHTGLPSGRSVGNRPHVSTPPTESVHTDSVQVRPARGRHAESPPFFGQGSAGDGWQSAAYPGTIPSRLPRCERYSADADQTQELQPPVSPHLLPICGRSVPFASGRAVLRPSLAWRASSLNHGRLPGSNS